MNPRAGWENFKRQRRNEINKAFLFSRKRGVRSIARSFFHPKPFSVALEKAFGSSLPSATWKP